MSLVRTCPYSGLSAHKCDTWKDEVVNDPLPTDPLVAEITSVRPLRDSHPQR